MTYCFGEKQKERNIRIISQFFSGVQQTVLASEYELTFMAINKIVKRYMRAVNPKIFDQMTEWNYRWIIKHREKFLAPPHYKRLSDPVNLLHLENATNVTLDTPLFGLGLSVRVFRVLMREPGIRTVGDLIQYSEKRLLGLPGIGKSYLKQIKKRLALYGLHLATLTD
jgi:hypothetical protein